jgi:hypothetical protein
MALKGQPKHPNRGGLLRPSQHQDLDLQVSLPLCTLIYAHNTQTVLSLHLYPDSHYCMFSLIPKKVLSGLQTSQQKLSLGLD